MEGSAAAGRPSGVVTLDAFAAFFHVVVLR
jgi:hypothetical protein